jgi:hypothetical protein
MGEAPEPTLWGTPQDRVPIDTASRRRSRSASKSRASPAATAAIVALALVVGPRLSES